jgi:hypothetical protein
MNPGYLLTAVHVFTPSFVSAASGHKHSPAFNTAVEKSGNHFLHGTADVRDNSDSGQSKRSLLGLRDHTADKKIYAKLWKQLRSFEGISRHKRFFLPMLLLLIRKVHNKNPACLIENR